MPGARSPSGLASAPLPQPRRSRSPRALPAASPGPSARSGPQPLYPSWDLGFRRRHGGKKVAAMEVPGAGRSWGRGRRALPGGAAAAERDRCAPTFSYRPLHLRGRGRHVWRRKVERQRYNPWESGADPGAKLQPERGAAAHGEGGALPVPAPSLIGGMNSPRARVSIQARLPLPASPRLASPASSSLRPPARRTHGAGAAADPAAGSGAGCAVSRERAASERGWRGDECFMGSCGLT